MRSVASPSASATARARERASCASALAPPIRDSISSAIARRRTWPASPAKVAARRALASARLAATFAGDAGHVRLRAMALLMLSRIGGASAEAHDARSRARAVALALGDATLLTRCDAAERDAAGA